MPQVSKSENLQEVGRKIRHYREKKKMSQLELAEAIGVTQNTIYLIETAQSEMKLEKLEDGYYITYYLDRGKVEGDWMLHQTNYCRVRQRQHLINFLNLNI